MPSTKQVDDLIAEAAERLTEAMEEAAADALAIVERFDMPLQTVCKRITAEAGIPEEWQALRARAQRMRKNRSEQPQSRASTLGQRAKTGTMTMTDAAAVRHAKRVLREAPETVFTRDDPEVAAKAKAAINATFSVHPDEIVEPTVKHERSQGARCASAFIEARTQLEQAVKDGALTDRDMTIIQEQIAGILDLLKVVTV